MARQLNLYCDSLGFFCWLLTGFLVDSLLPTMLKCVNCTTKSFNMVTCSSMPFPTKAVSLSVGPSLTHWGSTNYVCHLKFYSFCLTWMARLGKRTRCSWRKTTSFLDSLKVFRIVHNEHITLFWNVDFYFTFVFLFFHITQHNFWCNNKRFSPHASVPPLSVNIILSLIQITRNLQNISYRLSYWRIPKSLEVGHINLSDFVKFVQ